MMSCFNNAGKVFQEAWNKLEPGGWLELQDVIAPWVDSLSSLSHSFLSISIPGQRLTSSIVDGSLTNSTLLEFHTLNISAAKSIGRDVKQVITYPSLFSQAGFINIQEVPFLWPIGPWALDPKLKKVGEMFRDDLDETLEPIAQRLFGGVMNMEKQEMERLVDGARRDLWDVSLVFLYLFEVMGPKNEMGKR
jgi:hypothetical protein